MNPGCGIVFTQREQSELSAIVRASQWKWLFSALSWNLLSHLSFFQGKEPSDQHIKQVCMRVMQGKSW